jgi:hypothetical protein
MRALLPVAIAVTLSGCAAHRAQVAHRPDPLHDWASVVAIPRGTHVRVTLAYDIEGRLDDVTDSTLTLGRPAGMPPLTISGVWVVRVAVSVPKKMRWKWLANLVAVGVVGGLVGGLVGAVMRDAKVAAISFGVFTAGLIVGFNYFSDAYYAHEWRVVYVRP